MKKYILLSLLLVLSQWALLQCCPWWITAVLCFLVGYLFIEKWGHSFSIGFLSSGILWASAAVFLDAGYTVSIAKILSNIAGSESTLLIYLMPLIIGGLTGGLGAILGSQLRTIAKQKATVSA